MKKYTYAVATLLLMSSPLLHAELIDNGDGTITDSETSLMWLQDGRQLYPDGYGVTWSQSKLDAENLEFAGYNDWRQPEIGELEDLYNEMSRSGTFTPAPFINMEIDGYTDWYWSNNMDCTTGSWYCSDTWFFDFERGKARQASSPYSLLSLPVRSIETTPPTELVDNGDGTITDSQTNLMWIQDGRQLYSGEYGASWSQSKLDAENLEFAGYNDWRQPEIGELEDLYNEMSRSGTFTPAPFINMEIDGYTDWYWSNNMDCTTGSWYCSDAWFFDFERGKARQATSPYSLLSLPVRTISTTPPPPPASCELTDNSDGTITDPKAGLMWLKDADAVSVTDWNNASTIISSSNFSGYYDWRLPEIDELQNLYATLSDSGTFNPAPFSNLEMSSVSDWHWSNTAEGEICWWRYCQPTKYYVDFSTGYSGSLAANYSLNSIPVRTIDTSCN